MKKTLTAISYYSLMRGVRSPSEISEFACQNGYESVVITDRNNLYGFPETVRECSKRGLETSPAAEIKGPEGTLLLFARNREGFSSLCSVITEKQCEDKFSLMSSLKRYSKGLMAVSDDPGLLLKLPDILPVWYRIKSLRRVPALVRQNRIPVLVMPESVFLSDEDISTHRLLRAVDLNTKLSLLPENESFSADVFFRERGKICERFSLFEDALDETEKFMADIKPFSFLQKPVMPLLREKKDPACILRRKALRGAEKRYKTLRKDVMERLDYELDIIEKKGFSSYFLIVKDIVKQSPRTCGRGSAAASLVSYCLGITNVDPLRYNLMFERFISPGRKDPPDIDVDFAWDERDGVLDYVFDRQGRDHAAMVGVHQFLGPRMALREAARVFGMTESEISSVTEKFPYAFSFSGRARGGDIMDMIRGHPRLKGLALDPPWPEIISAAQKIAGMPRAIGTHCGGVVITPEETCRYAPVQISAKGYPVIQWEKDGTEDMGLVKIDLLGNRSLGVIRDALANLKREGVKIDENRWDPASDRKTIELLAKGRSIGVFYVESPAMRLLQKKTGAGDFESLVIHSSIIRPAANAFIQEYIKRLRGEKWEPVHPDVENILAETFGIMVYQEDVARVAMALAGFSFEEADRLRKIMTKKHRHDQLADMKERFYRGAVEKNVEREKIDRIWKMCLSFSGYSFCKPHSASYVQVSFQSAWLKAHHPAAFMAAVLSNKGGFYSPQAYISEASRLGIKVLGPDVNRSGEKYSSHGMSMRVGLGEINGLSRRCMESVFIERKKKKFSGFQDMLARCSPQKRDTECLIRAGACDSLEPGRDRAWFFWTAECFYRGTNGKSPAFKSTSHIRVLREEYRMLGFLTSRHPVTLVPVKIKRKCVKISCLESCENRFVRFIGWCVTSRTVVTKFRDHMQFVTFEDETGIVETVLFPDAYRKFCAYIVSHEAFIVEGLVKNNFGAHVVEVRSISLL